MKRTILLALFAAALTVAPARATEFTEHPEWSTCGFVNGRWWQTVSESIRLGYVTAVMDMNGIQALATEGKRTIIWLPDANVGELTKAIDQFYAEALNIRVPVPSAMSVIAAGFEGNTKQQAERLAESRTLYGLCEGAKRTSSQTFKKTEQ